MTETPENDRPDQDAINDTPDQDAIESPDPSGVAPYEPADSPAVDPAGTAGEDREGAQPAQTPDPNEADLAGQAAPAPGQPAEPAGVAAENGTDGPADPGAESPAPESPAPTTGESPAETGESPAEAGESPAEAGESPAETGESAAPTGAAPMDAAAEAAGAGTQALDTGGESPATPAAPQSAGEPPAQAGAAAAPPAEPGTESADEEYEPTPRVKPEIPGADLTPDIVPEGTEFMDAEARAAAEADAEAAADRDEEPEDTAMPIADAAIDLAAGARYTATGKRKTSVARVILKPGSGTYSINGKALEEFFPRETLQRIIRQPLETVGYESRMDIVARMHGGGVAAQAGALRHGISRALIVADPNLRGELKRRGFLTRDPRVKERKKAGLKKARKRPQFSKR